MPIKTDLERAKWLKTKLRRLSRFWPPATEALNKAKVAPGRFQCASCDGVFKRDEVHRDHIEPAEPPAGLTSTLELFERLFCFADGYQILCISCHNEKSALEGERRRSARKNKVLGD